MARPRGELQVNSAELVDEEIARRLWDSLSPEFRLDHFDVENMPDRYRRSLVRYADASSGRSRRSPAMSFRGLPEPMTWELELAPRTNPVRAPDLSP